MTLKALNTCGIGPREVRWKVSIRGPVGRLAAQEFTQAYMLT